MFEGRFRITVAKRVFDVLYHRCHYDREGNKGDKETRLVCLSMIAVGKKNQDSENPVHLDQSTLHHREKKTRGPVA